MEPLLTLFVLDDILVLLVHDGASETVLGPGRKVDKDIVIAGIQ